MEDNNKTTMQAQKGKTGEDGLLQKLKALSAYTVEEERFLPDLGCRGYVLRHNKSGARIALLPNDDNNKVFYIGFRTPPEDSTGVAHIIEHTVLCGSRDFPVKDPFIEVVKGSLNTFLNAMTYPDKTVYPVASTNEKDFANLMHVYLDAVFHPNIYTNESIFRQEGWHYEVKDEEGKAPEIVINGVVYNEMKGVMSSPDDVLNDAVLASLYPDTTYSIVSGGDPEVIPELSYEQYLAFHKRFYHPSNAYLYLYGDMDVIERLRFIDEKYLSDYDVLEVDSEIRPQEPFAAPVQKDKYYSILPEEDEKEKAYLSWNVALPIHGNAKEILAFRILDYVLCDAEGAPVKEALRKKGIGQSVESLYEPGIYEPYFSVAAKLADPEQKDEFEATILETLKSIAENGIDTKALQAGINYHEFHYREADFGSYPKGLVYGLDIMDTWLYEEQQVWDNLDIGHFYEELKDEVGSGYFEGLIAQYLLANQHRSTVVLLPQKGLTEQAEAQQKAKMAAFAASCSEEELQALRDKEAALRDWQNTPETKEALASIPVLERSDLTRDPVLPVTEVIKDDAGFPVLTHPVFTSGIDYVDLEFDVTDIPWEDLRYLGVLRTLMGALDTEHYSYQALDNEINIVSGGIAPGITVIVSAKDSGHFRVLYKICLKTMDASFPEALALAGEMLLATKWEDTGRIREVLEEERASMKAGLSSAGHSTAVSRASAALFASAAVSDDLSGIGMYRLLDELCSHFEEKKDDLVERLQRLCACLAAKERFFADVTAEKERIPAIAREISSFAEALSGEGGVNVLEHFAKVEYQPHSCRKEGFTTAGQVQFVCRAGNFTDEGLADTGALDVLRVILGYDYLWTKVRMNGGAYGCMSSFSRSGLGYLVSYRDPQLTRTIETFEGAADFVRSFTANEKEMTKYIIGTVSGLDRPMTPSAFGKFSQVCVLKEVADEEIIKERQQVLDCTQEDIQAVAAHLDAIMKSGVLCVVGASAKLKENAGLFEHLEPLV